MMMIMMRYLILSALLLACLGSCSGKQQEREAVPVVKTDKGFVSGITNNGVRSYKGVPYAAPPIGQLRWKETQPHATWKDTLKCTQFGASPMQNDPKPFMMWTEEFITPPRPLSEDGLYLNIWTTAKSPEEKLPVLVWIHGGAFSSGSGACAIYDGEALAKKGIIYVSINYRLGVFGFLAHPDLTKESGRNSSGNYGLRDQIEALKWIHNNIKAFGGNPDRVIIAGQSAGSMSVQALVASPLTKGLIHGAIAESGTITNRPSPSLANAEKTGLTLSEKIKAKDINALRALSADSVLALANTLPFGSFFPITDGYVLPSDPQTIFERKEQNDIPVLAGWVTGDADLGMREVQTADKFKAYVAATFKANKDEFLELFPASSDDEAKVSQRKLAVMQFAAAGDRQWLLSNKSKGYLYEFSYVPTDKPGFSNYGAFHTSEVPFALHTLSKWNRPWTEKDKKVEKYMSEYWINFVKTGDPNGKGLPEWKAYDQKEGNVMEFNEQPVLKREMWQKEFALIE
jgi:para-nitrobenzyl esterase